MAASSPIATQPRTRRWLPAAWVAALAVVLLLQVVSSRFDAFPDAWNLGVAKPLDAFTSWVVANRRTHWLFQLFFEPLSNTIDFFIRGAEDGLLWLPWPVIVAGIFLLAQRIGGLRLALTTSGALLFTGLLGLWDESMATLALMVTAVVIALLIGIPLGVWTARNDRAEAALRPVLDAMQTMPAFVYLIPVVLFFGIARVPSVIATVIYAVPPAVRLTNLGLRRVSAEILEAARAFGSTERQLLYKVQIPQALPSIMAGVNQTIMMALSIVVIAALIGSGGLGNVVLRSLRRLRVGDALEGGLAIVFLAVLLDRLSAALARIDYHSTSSYSGFRLLPERWRYSVAARLVERAIDVPFAAWAQVQTGIGRILARWPRLQRWHRTVTALLVLLALTGVCWAVGWVDFPDGWQLPLSEPVDAAVKWAQINLYQIGDTPFGTGPFSDFVSIYLLRPLRTLFIDWLSWPVVIVLVMGAALAVANWRVALLSGVGFWLLGALGLWDAALDTLSQVFLAVVLSVLIGVPLGIWAGRNATVAGVLRPLLDFFQTIPAFVYLVPVIMLFNLGRVPGIMASVLYALPPTIRLTSLGIRQVDGAAVESAESFGSTGWQTLTKVQLPLALPSIMLGINQTIMMVLAMVIIAGLVGAEGLGFEVVDAMLNNRMGASVEAGLAIVIMAIVLDRLTQAWAAKRAAAANLGGRD